MTAFALIVAGSGQLLANDAMKGSNTSLNLSIGDAVSLSSSDNVSIGSASTAHYSGASMGSASVVQSASSLTGVASRGALASDKYAPLSRLSHVQNRTLLNPAMCAVDFFLS